MNSSVKHEQRSSKPTLLALAGAAFLLVSAAATASAQDSEQEVALRFTWFNPTTASFGEVARSSREGEFATAGGWVGWLMSSGEAQGFGPGMTSRCVIFSRRVGPQFELSGGTCVYTDRDGDQLFEEYNGLSGQWVDGTGKYAGVTGSTQRSDIVLLYESGYPMLTGVITASFSLPE